MPEIQDIPVIDMLGGALGTLTPPRNNPLAYGQKMTDAGVDAIAVTMGLYARDIRPILREFFDYDCLFQQAGHRLMAIRTVADLLEARRTKRLGVILGVQGLHFIEDDTVFIHVLARLGLRVAALTYNEETQFGGGCMERTDGGLTLLGQRAVQELNRCGVLVDVSHAGHRTSLEMIEVSDKPVAATHSNAWTVCNSPRNLKDDQIRAIAAGGGIVGISPYSPFCGQAGTPRPGVEDVLDHICYVAELVGTAHVGIGTDFFPHSKVRWENTTRRMYPEMVGRFVFETVYAEGLEGHHEFPAIPAGLTRRGLSAADIAAILGGNAMRVFAAAWPEA